jgi:hypothetical protein
MTMTGRFEYGVIRIKDLQVRTGADQAGRTVVRDVLLDGRAVRPSNRFWTSLHLRFGFTANIFRYFSHQEVFGRISEVAANDAIRWCLEADAQGEGGRLLAVTNPGAALITHDDLRELLGRYDAGDVRYAEGVVSSRHAPRLNPTFQVGGDGFQNKYILETPVDGFGKPSVYLSLLRLVCSNGAVGYSPAFRSELSVGRGEGGVAFALTRVLDGFNNEDGYAALRQRFESATKSWASVNEVRRLYKLLARLHGRGDVRGAAIPSAGGDGACLTEGSPLFAAFHKMTGDLSQIYGLANLDTLSVKRQRTLPAACKVYDLLNFASEVATHHVTETGGRLTQAFIGELVSGEYDLEGTVEQFSDWRDFFIGNEQTAQTLADLNRRGR